MEFGWNCMRQLYTLMSVIWTSLAPTWPPACAIRATYYWTPWTTIKMDKSQSPGLDSTSTTPDKPTTLLLSQIFECVSQRFSVIRFHYGSVLMPFWQLTESGHLISHSICQGSVEAIRNITTMAWSNPRLSAIWGHRLNDYRLTFSFFNPSRQPIMVQ